MMYAYHCQVCQPNPNGNDWERPKVHSLWSLMDKPQICPDCKASLIKEWHEVWVPEIQAQPCRQGSQGASMTTTTCPQCSAPLHVVGTSHLSRSATLPGVGVVRLEIESWRCLESDENGDLKDCGGGLEISNHADRGHPQLHGLVWDQEGNLLKGPQEQS